MASITSTSTSTSTISGAGTNAAQVNINSTLTTVSVASEKRTMPSWKPTPYVSQFGKMSKSLLFRSFATSDSVTLGAKGISVCDRISAGSLSDRSMCIGSSLKNVQGRGTEGILRVGMQRDDNQVGIKLSTLGSMGLHVTLKNMTWNKDAKDPFNVNYAVSYKSDLSDSIWRVAGQSECLSVQASGDLDSRHLTFGVGTQPAFAKTSASSTVFGAQFKLGDPKYPFLTGNGRDMVWGPAVQYSDAQSTIALSSPDIEQRMGVLSYHHKYNNALTLAAEMEGTVGPYYGCSLSPNADRKLTAGAEFRPIINGMSMPVLYRAKADTNGSLGFGMDVTPHSALTMRASWLLRSNGHALASTAGFAFTLGE